MVFDLGGGAWIFEITFELKEGRGGRLMKQGVNLDISPVENKQTLLFSVLLLLLLLFFSLFSAFFLFFLFLFLFLGFCCCLNLSYHLFKGYC